MAILAKDSIYYKTLKLTMYRSFSEILPSFSYIYNEKSLLFFRNIYIKIIANDMKHIIPNVKKIFDLNKTFS